MAKIKKISNTLLWVILGLLISVAILTHTPSVQSFIGEKIGKTISEKIGADVRIGRVDFGFFNRLIIDDVVIYDKLHVDMLKAGRISAKFDVIDLVHGRLTITSAQLFTLRTHFYKLSSTQQPNFQFVLDSLASDNSSKKNPLELSVKSLIIRNGHFIYDEKYVRQTKQFSLSHINIDKISTHIMLNKLSEDSINIFIQKLSCKDHSKLGINDVTLSLIANKSKAILSNFVLKSQQSVIELPNLTLTYNLNQQGIVPGTLRYRGKMHGVLVPSNFSPIVSVLKDISFPITFNVVFSGSTNLFCLNHIKIIQPQAVDIEAYGTIRNWNTTPYWNATITKCNIASEGIKYYSKSLLSHYHLPTLVNYLENISLRGWCQGGTKNLAMGGILNSNLGNIDVNAKKENGHISGFLITNGLDVGTIANRKDLGKIDSKLAFMGCWGEDNFSISNVRGIVEGLEYKGYSYKNITIDYSADSYLHKGDLSIDDPSISAKVNLKVNKVSTPVFSMVAKIRSLDFYKLNIWDGLKGSTIDADIDANIKGTELNTSVGTISIANLNLNGGEKEYHLSNLTVNATQENNNHVLIMDSDFGHIDIIGRYNYATFSQSLINIIGNRLPTLPGLPKMNSAINNNFQIKAKITKSDWLNSLFGIPLQLKYPLALDGNVIDSKRYIDLTLNAPSFIYGTNSYEHGYLRFASPNNVLEVFGHLQQVGQNDKGTYWNIQSKAEDNKLYTLLSFENNGKNKFAGIINTVANFYKNQHDLATADVNILPSEITVGDSVWHVKPSTIIYYKDHLAVNQLSIEHNRQHININGDVTQKSSDTMRVDLHDVDISYILNLINFHSVEFAGKATGVAQITSLFNKPDIQGDFWVRDFKFEDGRMGILTANVALNHKTEQLDIEATAYDEGNSRTFIKGYVSPQRNYIDLHIRAQETRGEFLESFCNSFMDNTELKINGNVRVFGDLSTVNLEGDAIVDGTIGIKPLNTTYTLQACPVKLIPDEIKLSNCNFIDRNGNKGVVNGSIYHKHLTRISYDINTEANNILAYDFKDYGDQTFFGTVFATGDCQIKGKSGEVVIEAHATPQKGSFIEYNASSPESIRKQSFIHWNNQDSIKTVNTTNDSLTDDFQREIDIPSDILLNLHINCTPDATLRVLMDKQSGDYISLHGNGAIRATYFNKGDFDMFGTYEVTGGIYKLTVQNIIHRDFQFLPGGTIGFGGNAMDAILKLQAQYTVNGVSLSDLNVGKSFTSNNIRVNCLMNITGTPLKPKVDFGLDLPTISNDAKRMITQLINSEEGMNQQVLYLLAIGRFYSQNNNSSSLATTQQQSRTSLAMQSILSGTISQQLNSILSSVTKNDNWNFGANISTGDEGWNNAEYEGLLSGKMFNNRLLFNGQFGYRDKANATTSFIGDFDLQYLIYPNGNLAVRVYNQTSDRYFTKNSLNTQGIGLVLKKDFNGWRDLLGIRSHKEKKIKKQKQKSRKKKSNVTFNKRNR